MTTTLYGPSNVTVAADSVLLADFYQRSGWSTNSGGYVSPITPSASGLTVAQVDARIQALAGSSSSASMLAGLAGEPDDLFAGAITRDGNGAAISAAVQWPDGTPGTYTGVASTSFPGAVDSYTITYGNPVTRTFRQAAVTRDANGIVTSRPAITAS
ncbi:hypothetical protein [Enterococcus hirae]|uniref:hypothetical protein n=1 Tax=Enterococcus hirae TaxID=1354 RepID=UPI00136D89C9|nr:hypothetical protein [Enterococcus hirae]NAE18044.1 hypothetical protein [Enterococcus hirae]